MKKLFSDQIKLRYCVLSLLLVFLSQKSIAQTRDKPNAIGIFGVKTEYIGDLGNNVFRFGDDFRGGVGVSFDRFLSRFFDVGISGSFSSIGIDRGISTYIDFEDWYTRAEHDNHVQNFEARRLINVHLHGRFKILDSERFRLVPYVGLAVGKAFLSNIQTNYLDANGHPQTMSFFALSNEFAPRNNARFVGLEHRGIGSAYTLSGIIGLDFRISPHFSVRYQAVGSWTSRDDLDFHVNNGNDWQIQHNIGIVYRFSGRRPPPPPRPRATFTWNKPTPVLPHAVLHEVDTAISIRKEPKPDTFFFPAILLEFGRVSLSPKAQNQLDTIADWLIEHSDYRMHISGHTCVLGCKIYNQRLSERRAQVVKNYLILKRCSRKSYNHIQLRQKKSDC